MSKEENKEVTVVEKTHSARFTESVMKQFNLSSVGSEVQISPFQKKLIQNYFIKLDGALKLAETKRLAKPEQYRDALEFEWKNINMNKLAFEVVALSSVGLDPLQPNHINLIPYKNKATNQYDITAIIGYRGLELKATKYGTSIPDDVVVEIVYSTDEFIQFKKDMNNKVESYVLNIKNNFERGAVVGGFYYHKYFDKPERNKLRVFSLKDIEKRKPAYASAEFWGGEKDAWKNGKKVGKETIEGWFDEMCYKTIYRSAYNDITIDSEKIDAHLVNAMQIDDSSKVVINNQQTTEDATFEEVKEDTASVALVIEEKPNKTAKPVKKEEPKFDSNGQATIEPGF